MWCHSWACAKNDISSGLPGSRNNGNDLSSNANYNPQSFLRNGHSFSSLGPRNLAIRRPETRGPAYEHRAPRQAYAEPDTFTYRASVHPYGLERRSSMRRFSNGTPQTFSKHVLMHACMHRVPLFLPLISPVTGGTPSRAAQGQMIFPRLLWPPQLLFMRCESQSQKRLP